MILPGHIFLDLKNIKWNQLIHIGTVLLVLNIFVYLFFSLPEYFDDQNMNSHFTQNKMFDVFSLQKMYRQTLDHTADMRLDPDDLTFLKDRLFWDRAPLFPFQGDRIQIEKNKKLLLQVQNMYQNSNQYRFGLSHEATTPWAWLTYQFMHAGFFHLMTNMIFLVLIANILISRVEQGWILGVYILGGIGAGVSYLLFSPNNDISMVGASGSLCGLIAFLCTVENKKNIQWSYFLSPIQGGFGIIYLPAYLLFPVYLISDFTTVLYHSNGIDQAVAHSAHIGGALTGFILGFIFLAEQRFKSALHLKAGVIPLEQNPDASYFQ